MACRRFDAQVVHTEEMSPRGDLLSQYVRVRITDMTNIDIGLFDFDGHNALYYFLMNADEQIYMRYGGRDGTRPGSYLNLDSFELALRAGLDQHALYTNGTLAKRPRPAARFPRDIPLLNERIVKWGRCVECHLIDDYDLREMEITGKIDRVRDMYRFPDLRRIGIQINLPKGLEVEEATGPAESSGMAPGDLIVEIAGVPVFTLADLQHEYNKVDRRSKSLSLNIERDGKERSLKIKLPKEWWWTDLYHRFLSIEPLVYFENRELSAEEKKALGLERKGFASEVTKVDSAAQMLAVHNLEVGDIVFEVGGVTRDSRTKNCRLYMKLTIGAGDAFDVKVLRDGKVIEMKIDSERQSFRKESQ